MKDCADKTDSLFLGLDSSTQALKATLIDLKPDVVYETTVNFDSDLPEFKTEGGVHHHPDGLTVTAPALMWVAALDLLFARMRTDNCALERVTAISGSGQQHGSVWLKKGARNVLRNMNSSKSLRQQMSEVFSVADSPIWMDSSTGKQCEEREKALGGAQAVADLTGSRAYERFTGNQIAKIYQTRPENYKATERIALVSSFMASLMSGDYAPIDASDGAGMNLMDLRSKKWAPAALACTAPGLKKKLGSIIPSHSVAGKLHGFYAEKFGFKDDCLVIAFSGDNPNSLAGLRLQHTGDVAISLGTSDTVFGSLGDPVPSASEGHIFVNPVDPDAYMALVCYKNGSLTREHVRDERTEGSWPAFSRALQETLPGNGGNIGFYIKEPEITPPILKTGIFRFDVEGARVDAFFAEVDVRAVVEGQFLSMRLHGGHIGLKPVSILATGGASSNEAIIRIMSDVFGVPVYIGEQTDSASLGAAYRALHGWTCEKSGKFVPFAEVLAGAPPFRKAAEPDMDAHGVYTKMLERYEELEKRVISV